MLKRISVFAAVLVMMLSVFSFAVFANEPVSAIAPDMDIMAVPDVDIVVKDAVDIMLPPQAAKDAVEDAIADMPEVKAEKKMQFEPMAFVENLNIMGVGMLGIFIVIGAIILSVFVLNKLTSPKPSNKDE